MAAVMRATLLAIVGSYPVDSACEWEKHGGSFAVRVGMLTGASSGARIAAIPPRRTCRRAPAGLFFVALRGSMRRAQRTAN